MPATEAPNLPVHLKVRYEQSDIRAPQVLLTGLGILVCTWILVAALYLFYAFLTRHRIATTRAAPVRAEGQILVPPEPRLEVAPRKDLAALRALEDEQLNGYHWADKQAGTVTIPIERAMELIAQRGIPPQQNWSSLNLPVPLAGSRRTGFEGKVEPEPPQ